MQYIIYKKKVFWLAQIWYAPLLTEWVACHKTKADILFFHGISSQEVEAHEQKSGVMVSQFHTFMNSLTSSEEELFLGVHKKVKNEIRRSQKEAVEIAHYTSKDLLESPQLVEQFACMYQGMYEAKGMKESLNHTAFQAYMEADMVQMSVMTYEGMPIVFHTYILDGEQVRLLHSVSEFRNERADANLIGRGNKRLHLEDMYYYKELGVVQYDWGGISNLEQPNGIDQFKMRFGGKHATYYNVLYPNTFYGKCILLCMKLFKKTI